MYTRTIHIDEWVVEFAVMLDEYDSDFVMKSLGRAHAPRRIVREAYEIVHGLEVLNTGFTYINERRKKAVVIIGPSSSAEEVIDTFVHELYHLAVNIAESYGYDLNGEIPAYLVGDLAREYAGVIYTLGCDMYRHAHMGII